MKWLKRGLIFRPNSEYDWAKYYGMMPTPEYIPHSNLIKVYFGTTDKDRFGCITSLCLDADNPSVVLSKISDRILFSGEPGTFDDSGAIPSSILSVENKKFLYYVGFQRTVLVPYMLFPGLAVSEDDGINFYKYSNAPILDRSKAYYISFAAPYVMKDGELFKMWLWIGKSWTKISSKYYIQAVIGYAESIDGISWKIVSDTCINLDLASEFSVGRPWVLKEGGIYKMWYSVRKVEILYRLGYAESTDGINWIRKDEEVGIDVSAMGWDSDMICYPAVIKVKQKTFLFYNGNNNGETGFGYAELIEL